MPRWSKKPQGKEERHILWGASTGATLDYFNNNKHFFNVRINTYLAGIIRKITDMSNKKSNIDSIFGERLRQILKSKRLKQVDISREFGIDKKHLNAMLNGKANLSFSLLAKLYENYNISVDQVISGNDIDLEGEKDRTVEALKTIPEDKFRKLKHILNEIILNTTTQQHNNTKKQKNKKTIDFKDVITHNIFNGRKKK